MLNQYLSIFRSAVLAGLAISLGGIVYLKTNSDLTGAIMFSFGLLTVVHYRLMLYTGKAGFFKMKPKNSDTTSLDELFVPVLIGNAVGCLIAGAMCWISLSDVMSNAQALVEKRLDAGFLVNFILAIPCGFIMTTAVEFGKNEKFLPLLFGVPLFIVCGFRHSIADAFYYCASGLFSMELFLNWIFIVLGNFVGCNIYRVVMHKLI